MSLVLAVQSDPVQAAQLRSACRRVGVELVLAASAPEALAALGDRVPDVILSAPLLPASDETAIAEHLRTLGEDALHVQALSLPVLGAPVVEARPRGLLQALRRERPAVGPAICDPLDFAVELSGHLMRAVAERAAITGERIEAPPIEDVYPEPDTTSGSGAGSPGDTERAGGRAGVPEHRANGEGGSGTSDDPVAIDPALLSNGSAEKARPRQRTRQSSCRRKRRTYDDAAYFDPARCEFAAVVEKFDEFTRKDSRRA